MPEYTTGGIQYPIAGDLIKEDSVEAKLARDMRSLAVTADQAIADVGAAASTDATTKADNARTAAINDATTKYGELPDKVAELEQYKPETMPNADEFAHVVLDEGGKLIEGERWDGSKHVTHLTATTVDTPAGKTEAALFDGYAHVTTDAAGKLVYGERDDGTIHIPHLDVDSLNGGGTHTVQKIVIVAGQSNSLWKFNTDGPALAEPDGRLKWWNRISGTMIEVSPKVTPSIASAFSRQYLTENEDVQILVVPVTVGSTGFMTSSISPPPEGYLYSSGGTWDRTLTADPNNLSLRLFESLAGALAATDNAEVLGMLWSQGENDRTRMTEATYSAAFDDFIGQVRTITGQPDMPVIIGSMTPEEIANPQFEGTEGILRALEGTQARLENTAYVWGPPNHLKYQEQIHFNPEGNRERGTRMAGDGLRRARLNLAGSDPFSPRNPRASRVGDQVSIEWDYPLGRSVSFNLETSPDGTTWAPQTLDGPLVTSHTITSTATIRARVSTTNEVGTSYPTMEVQA